jgi:hypothetical protein
MLGSSVTLAPDPSSIHHDSLSDIPSSPRVSPEAALLDAKSFVRKILTISSSNSKILRDFPRRLLIPQGRGEGAIRNLKSEIRLVPQVRVRPVDANLGSAKNALR